MDTNTIIISYSYNASTGALELTQSSSDGDFLRRLLGRRPRERDGQDAVVHVRLHVLGLRTNARLASAPAPHTRDSNNNKQQQLLCG